MLVLMNSAMMPCDGCYCRATITANEAKNLFQKYQADYKSYVGYNNACRVLSELFDCYIDCCRDETILKKGDVILVAKLKYRVNPGEKAGRAARQHGDSLSDYQFCRVTYEEISE